MLEKCVPEYKICLIILYNPWPMAVHKFVRLFCSVYHYPQTFPRLRSDHMFRLYSMEQSLFEKPTVVQLVQTTLKTTYSV